MQELELTAPYIQLSQLLKCMDWAMSGGEAKYLIQNGDVLVNGEVETRRGKKLYAGDIVRFAAEEIKLVAATASETPD